jgi:flavin-dependent dehydrogenase
MNNHNNQQYDVAILGGGLAGLTLSIQLKQRNPQISIIVLEKREDAAPTAAHKVGESTVELGTYYLREVLNLKDYLDKHELPKHGLRFYFSPKHKTEVSRRVELGPRNPLPVQSHQLDRGTLENELINRSVSLGNKVMLGAGVTACDLSKDGNSVTYKVKSDTYQLSAKWVVDATSRFSFLKRKLQFQKQMEHNINSVWFRVKGEIDITRFSDDKKWQDFIRPGLRRLGTVHFMDEGYWLWFIPLGSGNTSIGIVADPRFHPFEEINTYDKAMQWIHKNEPVSGKILEEYRNEVLDFRVLMRYSHHSGRFFSSDRWAVTGEAGAFLDPLYSPGTDFISLSNSFLTDLICRDIEGENIELYTEIYEKTYDALVNSWIPVYLDKYQLMGSTQIMVVKIFWDWAVYWSFQTLLFTNNGFTNLKVLKALFSSEDSPGRKIGMLNKQMQDVFIAWKPYDTADFTNKYIDPFDLEFLRNFHKGIENQYDTKTLVDKVIENKSILESVAAEIFRNVSHLAFETPLDMKVNPYEMVLDKNYVLQNHDYAIGVDEKISADVDVMWFYPKKELV